MNFCQYSSPLSDRYAGKEMSHVWSAQFKHSTWRRLWLSLAKCEKDLGLAITQEQIDEMQMHLDDIDFARAAEFESQLRHDVMSHIHAFGEQCPNAMPIIHLGATSCFVTDNTELIQLRKSLQIIKGKLLRIIKLLSNFCDEKKDLVTLGFTHYQVAQLTTVGKRFSLYLQDFLNDFYRVSNEIDNIPFRSIKGTTGTQASFLELFEGNHNKVKQLEKNVAASMGFEKVVPLSGQTYSRKIDYYILSVLSGIAQSAMKMASDIRLLANLREIEEPFGKKQIGSSAMAYKRNPMRSERICSLSRFVMSLPVNCAMTEGSQWFERTLDDSANRRIVLPEAFITSDIILSIVENVIDGILVWPKVIGKHVEAELPFMATENLLMAAVKKGGNRQELHEVIREHSMAAAKRIKEEGGDNDLLERLKSDKAFACIVDDFDSLLDPKAFIGRAPQQVEDFLNSVVIPLLKEHSEDLENTNKDEVLV